MLAACCCGCAVTVTGTVVDCSSSHGGIAGATVIIRTHTGGSFLGTGTTDGTGHFSIPLGTVALAPFDAVVTFGSVTQTVSNHTMVCGTNALGTVTLQTRSFTITIGGCTAMPGRPVTFTQSGVAFGPYTTNGSAQVTVSGTVIGVAGTITSPAPTSPAGYNPISASYTPTCSSSGTTASYSLQADYTCSTPGCCPVPSGPPYYAPAFPATAYLNDGIGVVTMTYDGGSIYTGSASRTLTRGGCGGNAGDSAAVGFKFECLLQGQWRLTATCNAGLASTLGGATADADSCPPTFHWTSVMSATFSNNLLAIYGTATPTMTVTQ